MGALPKRKVSRGRRDRRRTHQFVTVPDLVPCPNCGKMMRAHRVCMNCGEYQDKQIFVMED
jgi:large subunit ribosomal protein L32